MKKQLNRAVVAKEKNFTASKEKPNVKKPEMLSKTGTGKKVAKTAGIAVSARTPAKIAKKHTPSVSMEKTISAVAESVKKACFASSKKQPVKLLKKSLPEKTGREEVSQRLKLSKADKKFFYGLLMAVRAVFDEQIKFHSEAVLSSHKDSAGERVGMATHMADLGTDNFRHDFELGLMSKEVNVLEMVDEALLRLESSEYGICLDCGAIIPRERLEVTPYAQYCTKCKSRREEMDEFR